MILLRVACVLLPCQLCMICMYVYSTRRLSTNDEKLMKRLSQVGRYVQRILCCLYDVDHKLL